MHTSAARFVNRVTSSNIINLQVLFTHKDVKNLILVTSAMAKARDLIKLREHLRTLASMAGSQDKLAH